MGALQRQMQQQAVQVAAAQAQATTVPGYRRPPAFSPLIDTRMLTKPKAFSGRDEDWASWAVVTRAYCGALDPRLLQEMTAVESAIGLQDNAGMNEEQQRRSCTLYYLLAMLVDGRSQSMVTNCPVGLGFELWRRLVLAYEPKIGSRAQGLLVQILMYEFNMSDFLSSLEKWETFIRQYDGAVAGAEEKIQGSVKMATVISRIGKGPLQDHLMLNSGRYENYEGMRAEIVEVLRAQRHMAKPGAVQSSGSIPMEVGAIANQSGKIDKRDVQCHACGKKGHYARECWTATGAGGAGVGRGSVMASATSRSKGLGKGKDRNTAAARKREES